MADCLGLLKEIVRFESGNFWKATSERGKKIRVLEKKTNLIDVCEKLNMKYDNEVNYSWQQVYSVKKIEHIESTTYIDNHCFDMFFGIMWSYGLKHWYTLVNNY